MASRLVWNVLNLRTVSVVLRDKRIQQNVPDFPKGKRKITSGWICGDPEHETTSDFTLTQNMSTKRRFT